MNQINISFTDFKKVVLGIVISLFTGALVLSATYSIPTLSKALGNEIIANATTPTEAFNKLEKSKGGVLGTEVQNKVTNLGSDIQSLVISVVMAILSVSTLWTSTKFSTAGDNPQAKASLKNALVFQVGGIAFLASYSGLLLFGLKNLNLFG